MDLYEWQAKELFAKHGVPTTGQVVVTTADEAYAAAEQLGGGPVMVAIAGAAAFGEVLSFAQTAGSSVVERPREKAMPSW